MDKKLSDTATHSVKSSITLLMGNTTALIIDAIGAIIVARILSPSEYGLYTISLVLPSFFNFFTSWGVNKALTLHIAQQRKPDSKNIKELIQVGYIFNLATGSILSLIIFFFSDYLAITLLNKPEVAYYLQVASFITLFQSIFNTGLAIFIGYEKMNYQATVRVMQSIIKGIFSPLLVYFGFGILGAVIGHTISYLFSGIMGLILIGYMHKNKQELQLTQSYIQSLKYLITLGSPLFLSQLFLGASNQIRGVFLSWYIADEIIGNYSIAVWFSSLIGVIVGSIGTTLLPTFSKFDVNHETERTKEIYQFSIRFSSIILMPLICLMIVASEPIVTTIFGTKYLHAPLFLSYQLIPTLFIGLGSISNVNLLNSQGETRAALLIMSFGSILTVILSYISITNWGIIGLLTGIIISSFTQNLLSISVIKKIFNLKPDLVFTIKLLIASAIAGIISYIQQIYIISPYSIISLLMTSITYISVYLITAPLIGAIELKDITALEIMIKKQQKLYSIAKILINLEKSIIKIKNKYLTN